MAAGHAEGELKSFWDEDIEDRASGAVFPYYLWTQGLMHSDALDDPHLLRPRNPNQQVAPDKGFGGRLSKIALPSGLSLCLLH
jgi:hypothetical protein